MISYTTLLPFICMLTISVADVDDPTLVNLPEGQIRGHILNTPNNKQYYAFQEIPYAAPPVGKLRFQSPVPVEKWDDILNTTRNTKMCYQSGEYFPIPGIIESEDCLYLNVYTPVIQGDDSITALPVLVWIHGGGFQSGTGIPAMYKPHYLVEHGIVIVSINYRLGIFGFLSTEDGVIPGNIGLRDQHLALQWVKKNIILFGGDPEKVTISGESAGAVAVGFHLINQKNQGLFRAAILQSGTAIFPSRQDYARFYAFELGQNLNSSFTSDDSEDLLVLLQSLPASDISNNTVVVRYKEGWRLNGIGSGTMVSPGKDAGIVEVANPIWLPIIEDANLEDTFLTGPYQEDIKNGNINQVPILLGFNSEESLYFLAVDPTVSDEYAKEFDNDLSSLIKNTLNMTKENKLTAGRKLREIYTDGLFQDDLGNVVKFLSDTLLTTPAIRHAKLQSNYTDVYLYQFSYKGELPGMMDLEIGGVRGVAHTEELTYLWDAITFPNPNATYTEEDLIIRDRLLTLWSNFVKYLNPTPEKDDLLENVTWEKVTPTNLVYLDINSKLDIRTNPKEYLKYEKIIDVYAIPPLINY